MTAQEREKSRAAARVLLPALEAASPSKTYGGNAPTFKQTNNGKNPEALVSCLKAACSVCFSAGVYCNSEYSYADSSAIAHSDKNFASGMVTS